MMKLLSSLTIFLCFTSNSYSQVISLSGIWKFQLDSANIGLSEAWFSKPLADTIQLPGSCEEHGFGTKATVKEVNRLTREIRYEGMAWYQKEIEIPVTWTDKRI